MVIQTDDDFDLDKIADSGQCFRWEKLEESPSAPDEKSSAAYRIIAGADCLYISALGDGCYELDCTREDYSRFWQNYFDLRENYSDIRARIDRDRDPFLWEASEQEKGIRILCQNPWEMLITFIISQNRNIPAIRRSVELLAEKSGTRRKDSRGLGYYTFPEPAAISGLTEKDLSDCSLGYRCGYVKAAAEAMRNGSIDFSILREADHAAAMKALTGLYGVGIKVASCVSLFGLHHTDAFPIDVWMKRILAEHYPDGYPYDRYSPYNGIYQQFMFAWYRHAQK